MKTCAALSRTRFAGTRPFPRLWLLAALACPACSGGSDGCYPVEGKVLYRGEPARGAVVIFHPKDDESLGAVRPSGVTGDDGTFTLSSGKNRPGAPPGSYVVTVTWPEEEKETRKKPVGTEPPESPPDRLKGRYANQTTSPLRAVVKPTKNKLDPLELE
jgi:hypothetical protein